MSAGFKPHEVNLRELLIAGDLLGIPEQAVRIAKRGGTVKELYRAYAERPAVADTERMLGLSPADTGNYSLLSLIRSRIDPDKTKGSHERDISALISAKTGNVANGEYVPFSALSRNFDASNFVGAARLGEYSDDPLRKVFSLAKMGATIFSGLSATAKVPVFDSATAAAYLTETGSATNILETTRLVDLSPRRISALMIMSRESLFLSTPELDAAVKRQLAIALDEALQAGIFAGDGAGANPTGILNDSAVNIEVGGATGATLTFQHLVNMEYSAAIANVQSGARGWVINAATQKYLRTKARGTNLPFILGDDNQVLGAPIHLSNNMPANLTKSSGSNLSGLLYSSDWSQLLIGFYGGGVDLTVDPFTLASTAQIRIIATVEVGFGLRQPTGFSVMKDAALA